MRKTIVLSALMMLFVSSVSFASTSKYTIDDNAVEAAFDASTQVNFADMLTSANALEGGATLSADPNGWVAAAIAFFIGGIAIHRVYLGGRMALVPIYFFTCGGIFGIVPLVDFFVLVIGASKDDISQYVGNDKFIMWN